MRIHPEIRRALPAMLAIALIAVSTATMHSLTAATLQDCVGKPYGTPGCPKIDAAEQKTQIPEGCGDAEVKLPEQCDLGPFNGLPGSSCTRFCKKNICGDGFIMPTGSGDRDAEECEPAKERVYALNPDGTVWFEDRFVQATCGRYCQPPQCDEAGCHDGCYWVFSEDSCESSSAEALPLTKSSAKASAVSQAIASAETSTASESHAAAPAAPAVPNPNALLFGGCGDGILQAGEECDKGRGNDFSPGQCRPDCTLPRCGDGIVDPNEQCDDGKGNGNEPGKCRATCVLPRCGDGVVDRGEQCDEGRENSFTSGQCRPDCSLPRCGDSVVDPEEECDEGKKNGATPGSCRATCVLPHCGDGVVDPAEQCDDGNNIDGDGCSSACKLPRCGDNKVDPGEDCDDGNTDNTDTCSNTCKHPACGDGIVSSGEECDEGFNNSDIRPDSCRTSCKRPICGDRVTDAGEECDGGSQCSHDCKMLKAAAEDKSSKAVPPALWLGMTAALLIGAGSGYWYVARKWFPRKTNKSLDVEDIPLNRF